MNAHLIEKYYLDKLISKSEEALNQDFNLKDFQFTDFEYVNAYLLCKAFFNNQNLLIKLVDKEDKTNLYVPTIFILSLINFYKNYIEYKPNIQIGDILQEFGDTYQVTEITETKYKMYCSTRNFTREIDKSKIETLIKIKGKLLDRRAKQKFDSYKNFFNSILKIGNKVPSEFKYKSLIVTSKEIINALKNYRINIQKAFPFEYITKNNKHTSNLPIDPMIYIANDYETAKEFILDRNDVNVDFAVFIGASKYRDNISIISDDRRKEKFENYIFIGNEDVKNLQNLKKWNWTKPELLYYTDRTSYSINEIIVDDQKLTCLVDDFHKKIHSIENQFQIDLTQYYNLLNRIFSLAFPNNHNISSNQIEELRISFDRKGEDIILDRLDEIGIDDYYDYWIAIKNSFNEILVKLGEENRKFEAILKLRKIDYLVVQKRNIDVWEKIINERFRRKIRVISYKDYTKLRSQNSKKICFIAFYGFKHFKSIVDNENEISIVLYSQEKRQIEKCKNRYQNELMKEYCSEDRKQLSDIEYPFAPKDETTSDVIERLFNQHPTDEREYDYLTQNLSYEIYFNDSEFRVLDSNKTVLLASNGTELPVKVHDLNEGNKIRVYDNTTKEKLFDVALEADNEGRFGAINAASKRWKLSLIHYFMRNLSDLNKLFEDLKANGLKITNINTLKKWLDINDNVKFPQNLKDLHVIKKTINDESLNKYFDKIKRARKYYNSIMIALGRDLSDEITNFILNKEKGKILIKFSDDQINEIVQMNAPIRKIHKIKVIENEYEN
ncbi:MAG: hypothetical protein GF353_29530 [Candidatus Lokiarchaeota archaeon]|nr:hypothetical protein [Candidatus Lokiarchaeota archaeon]